jgi:hypothetical protein
VTIPPLVLALMVAQIVVPPVAVILVELYSRIQSKRWGIQQLREQLWGEEGAKR